MEIQTPEGGVDRRELFVVALVLAALHTVFWLRYWPLPHYDLNAYLEPGILLATEGRLAGPGSQYLDLTLTQAAHFYPPGFALLVGGWVAAFGAGLRSLLAYTHFVHAAYLFCLWILVRARFGCDRLPSALAVATAFPFFAHGRPDVTSLALAAGAWAALPPALGASGSAAVARTLASSALLGMSVLVSPSFGIGSAAAIGTYALIRPGMVLPARVRRLALLIAASLVAFLGIWAAVLTWQDAWAFGPEQFRVNAAIRGRELNTLDIPASFYTLLFVAIPLGGLALAPALYAIVRRRRFADSPLWLAAMTYMGGFVVWVALSSQQLLIQHHFAYLARVPLHGTLAARISGVRRVGIPLVTAFLLIQFYYQKNELFYLFADLEGAYERAAELPLQPGQVTAVDSPLFPVLYREGTTLNYELVKANSWERYRDATSPAVLALLPADVRAGPQRPDRVILSALGIIRAGIPDTTKYRYTGDQPLDIPRRRFLGRTIPMPQDPLSIYTFVRTDAP
ncbi:MAG: hypothetical protein M3365_11655 [Gemmatimonadota bacterium]|nr:hypothetical protein [Gemmatimonadota bacterium]